MAVKKHISGLGGKLGGVKVDGANVSRFLSASKPLAGRSPISPTGPDKPGAPNEVRAQSLSEAGAVKGGLKFGSPSSNRTTQSQGTSEWANLLKQTASGGVSSAFGGGVLSAVGGLGGLVSSIAGLFGGSKKTQAPLTLFQLPSSQDQTVFVNSKTTGSASVNTGSGGISGPSPVSSATGQIGSRQAFQNQSTEIAQAVKQALLNSSSLNDVIAEI